MENRLEHNYLTRVRNVAAVAEERGRVARDVHDGVLQSLTSVALQGLETVRRQLETKPLVAAAGIRRLQNMILLEQQSLRSFVRQLQGDDEVESDSGLSDLLTELARRLERQWDLMIKLNILLEPARLNTVIPPRLAREIYQVVREALVNVARHAQASQAWVSLDATDEEARLIVADDGTGFPSIGYMEHADLLRHGRGPKMLMARVGALQRLPLDRFESRRRAAHDQAAARPMTIPAIRLVLVDDHPVVLAGLEKLFGLEPDLEVVGRCTNGEEGISTIQQQKPDVVVLDLSMRGMNGLALLRKLDQRRPPPRVVLLTISLSEDQMLEAFRLGVRGIVLKEMAPKLLIDCIRKVHAGERWFEKTSLGLTFDRLVGPNGAAVLTPRETDIVRIVAGTRPSQQGDCHEPVHHRGHGQDPPAPYLRKARRRRAHCLDALRSEAGPGVARPRRKQVRCSFADYEPALAKSAVSQRSGRMRTSTLSR